MQLRRYGKTWYTGRCTSPGALVHRAETKGLQSRTTCPTCQPTARHVPQSATFSSTTDFSRCTGKGNTLMCLRRHFTTGPCQESTWPVTDSSIPTRWSRAVSTSVRPGSAAPAALRMYAGLFLQYLATSIRLLTRTCM